MQVLLRKCDNKYYVWKNAVYEDDTYYIVDSSGDKYEVKQRDIVATKDDPRVGYVVCQHCGELIKNDPESIEAHYAAKEAEKNCIKCIYLHASKDRQVLDATSKKNDDGTYTVTQTFVAGLYCKVGYWQKPIESQEADKDCVYYKCRRSGVGIIDDTFVKYPGVFEKFITSDVLLNKKFEYVQYKNGYFEYDCKCRGTLRACVNEMGVVDHFRLYYRYNEYDLYYSEKYDRLFVVIYGRYREIIPSGIPDKKMEQIKEKIAALYKEANK